MSIAKEAKRLHALGLAVHWLMPKSKRPVESGWTTGPRKSWIELRDSYNDGYNLGVRLGEPSKIGSGYLAVVDVDVKSKNLNHFNQAITAVRELLGDEMDLAPCVSSGRGNGSRHFYVLTSSPFKTFNPAQSDEIIKVHMPSKRPSKTEREQLTEKEIMDGIRLSHAWEVSLYSNGRQVVLPPSIHPDTGKPYIWALPLMDADKIPIIEFEIPKDDDQAATTSSKSAHEPLEDFKATEVELDWLPISDEVRLAIKDGVGVTDRSGYLLRASTALFSAGLDENEVLSVLTDPKTFIGAVGYDHAKTKSRKRAAEWVHRYTVARVKGERSAASVFSVVTEPVEQKVLTPDEEAAQTESFLLEINWKQSLDRGAKGKCLGTLNNLDLILSNVIDERIFIHDLFASRISYGVATPWGAEAEQHVKDIDMIKIKHWFGKSEFGIEPPTNAVLEATNLIAHRNDFHPVKDWLQSLKWDGVKRVNTWLKDYCQGDAPEPYLSEVSRKFLLAMIKRIFEPGCQWDYVLILEGEQGKYKSSIARALAGDKWFMDNLPDLKDKDAMLNLQGKWLIELGELTNVKRSDYNLVKAYLVRRTDTVRPHYGRIMDDVPRQSVFIGTVNEGQYLKDPTGNRRYLPVKVGTCDVPGMQKAREQLFAEAMEIYKTKSEILMLGPDATKQAAEAQEERRVDDDETEMQEALERFLNSEASIDFNFNRFGMRELFVGVGVPWGRWADKGYAVNNGASILRRLGFERWKSNGERLWRRYPKVKIDVKMQGTGRVTGGEAGSVDMDFF